jgi:hypothetical protein
MVISDTNNLVPIADIAESPHPSKYMTASGITTRTDKPQIRYSCI